MQTELISGDQNGNIRVWDLIANSCSCELVIVELILNISTCVEFQFDFDPMKFH